MASSTSIIVNNNKILLILRDNKPDIPEPNTWQLPGGGVENGEDHLQAIQRELQEEISILPKQLKYLGSAIDDTKVFLAFITDEEAKNVRLGNEGAALDFFDLESALKKNLTKKLRFYLERFRSGIEELVDRGVVSDISKIGLA